MGSVDQGFVPAPPDRVYARLAAVDGYGAWWPGARTVAAGGELDLRVAGFRGRVLVEGERPATGLVVRVDGAAPCSLEWYLEPFKEGTVVNAILDLGRGTARRQRRARRSIRRALVALRAWGESA